jgi:hypothetical protein
MMSPKSDFPLPPVLAILLEELGHISDFPSLARTLDDMRSELTDQAEWTATHFDYAERFPQAPERFVSVPTSGMDPFGYEGACEEAGCRIDGAVQFARSVGLFSDVAIVSDPFTSMYLGRESRLSDSEVLRLLTRLLVARTLLPFLRAGIVQFKSPYALVCNSCLSKLHPTVNSIAEVFVRQNRRRFSVKRCAKDQLAIDLGDLIMPSLVLRLDLTKRSAKTYEDPKKRYTFVSKLLKDIVAAETHRMIIESGLASHVNGVVLSNSRIGTEAMLALEMRKPPDMELWERRRSTQLPWVRDLSPQEVIQLRETADTALPRLRARLASALRLGEDRHNPLPGSATALVDELREDAAEVKAELAALTPKRGRAVRTSASVLGLGVALYGLATDMPAISFATLFGLLGLVHTVGRREGHEIAKLKSRPGYVLVQAENILAHRPANTAAT